jgi:aminoglycoside phosphotransferase (APT) family kinase protein
MDTSDWATDRELTNGVVRQLVDEQFPALRGAALARLGEGWDAETWQADDEWVLRFPKRRDLVRQLERETEVLRLIADRLPLLVPRFELFGRPGPLFPYPFVGYRKLPGRPAIELLSVTMTDDEAQEAARALGAFLTELHCVPLDAVPGDLGRRDADAAEFAEFAEMFAGFELAHPAVARRVVEFRQSMGQIQVAGGPPVLLHADLLPEHVLLSRSPVHVTGVIDWGDVSIGPAVCDFTGLYAWRGRAFAERVLADYQGPVAPADLDWMRVRALSIGIANAEYGRLANLPRYVQSGLRMIDHALAA